MVEKDLRTKGSAYINTFLEGAYSSAGRASDLHSEGRRFDPDQLHKILKILDI